MHAGGSKTWWWNHGGVSYHEGEEADERMRHVASKRGVHLDSISRPLTKADLEHFDKIICADDFNIQVCDKMLQYWILLLLCALILWSSSEKTDVIRLSFVQIIDNVVNRWAEDGTGWSLPEDGVLPRVHKMVDYAPKGSKVAAWSEIPDPYYLEDDLQPFDQVVDLVEEAADGLLNTLIAEFGISQ